MLYLLMACVMLVSTAGCARKNDPSYRPPADSIIKPEDLVDHTESEDEPETEESTAESSAEMHDGSVVTPAEDPGAQIFLILPSEGGASAEVKKRIEDAGEQLDFAVVTVSDADSAERQTQAFATAIDAHAALIVCMNVDREATVNSVQDAKRAGIPVILLDKGMDVFGIASSQIITDYFSCIRQLAQRVRIDRKSKGRYLRVLGTSEAFDAVDAFSNELPDSMVLLQSEFCDETSPSDAYDHIWDLLRANPKADFLVVFNVTETFAALDAMADLGIEMDIICLYGDDRITEMLEDGRVYASIMSPSDSIALKAREQIITYLFSNTLPTSECFYVRGEVRLTDAPRTSEEENAEENGEEEEDAGEGTADGDTGEPDEGEIDSGDTDESEQRSGDSA